ncbi:MAG: MarR family winged helix-turn-helix transcriptional regulator [Flavobacteriales bacterium]|jgi:DNA-binding MarR family transcriptional regulator
MSLEEDIKQVRFNSEYQKLMLNIFYTSNWLGLKHSQLMKEYGLTGPQFNILRILRGQKGQPMSVNALIERMLDKSSNASRIVDKLEEKKLVLRKVCPNDRRQVEVTITSDGLQLLKQLDSPMDALEDLVKGISLDEAKLVNQLLEQIRNSNKSK